MKYLIAGKSIVSGTHDDDSGIMREYFELGWETVGSRIDAIALYNQGLISPEDTCIVTTKDRMFFYSKWFDNVMDHDLYEAKDEGLLNSEVVDWTENHLELNFCKDGFIDSNDNQKYARYDEDKELITEGWDLSNAITPPSKPFIVLAMRWRAWCPNRNTDVNFFEKLIRKIKTKYTNIPIFIVGRGFEEFCKKNYVTFLTELKDYVSLIKSENCMALVGQSTGTTLLALTCADTDIHVIDPSGASELEGNNAVLGGKPVQFCSKGLRAYVGHDLFGMMEQNILDSIEENIKKRVDKRSFV